MLNNIKYKIEFFTDWHCSSGLTSGSDIDLLVIKDRDNFPFVPGKTIKGLLREAIEDIILLRSCYANNTEVVAAIQNIFGNKCDLTSTQNEASDKTIKGYSYFTNAELSPCIRAAIKQEELSSYLYRRLSSTAINDCGVAKKHSLRKIQTTIPCELYGEIHDIEESFTPLIISALKSIKRLGYNRNRGLGRCNFTIIERDTI